MQTVSSKIWIQVARSFFFFFFFFYNDNQYSKSSSEISYSTFENMQVLRFYFGYFKYLLKSANLLCESKTKMKIYEK